MSTNEDINKTIIRQPRAPMGSGDRQACVIVISGAETGRTHRIESDITDIGRAAVAATPVSTGDSSLPVTASLVVACTAGSDFEAPDALFKAADRALYASKARGRNRVSGHGQGNA